MRARIHRPLAAAWLVLACLLPSSGRASERLDAAGAAYREFEYDRVIEILRQIPKDSMAVGERARAHLLRGMSRFELGDREGARRDFRAALTLELELAAPPDTSPKILLLLEEQRAVIRAARKEPEIVEVVVPGPPSRRWTWWVGGAGLTGLVVGGVFGGLALDAESSFEDARFADVAEAHADDARGYRQLALGFAVSGAVLSLASVLLYVLEPGAREPPSK